MINKQKTINDPLGAVNGCQWFNPCPLCYGCRNHDSNFARCQKCFDTDKKFNICNTDLHKEEILSMMIRRETITIN